MPPDSRFHLVVTSFNIRLGIQQGLPALAESLKKVASPDILALQEVGDRWLMGPEGDTTKKLSALFDLPHHTYVPTLEESHPDGSTARYGHALLSRWPIASRAIIDLPRKQDEPRRLLRSQIDHPSAPLEVLSTHLSHLPDERPNQGRFLQRWLDDHPPGSGARFLLGDLNADASDLWLSSLLKKWTDADAKPRRPTFPAHDPVRRIDYVLGQNADWLSTDVPPFTEVSDHRPVVSRWRLDSQDRN